MTDKPVNLTPAQEWEAWVTLCMNKAPKLNPNETGILWANEEIIRLRKVIIELERKDD